MGASAQPQGQDGQDDLAILHPDRPAEIAGVKLTMREYRFAEALALHAPIARFTDAFTQVALDGNFADLDSLRSVFGERQDDVVQLIAAACDQPPEWVASLSAEEGENLLLLWWSVNSPFFVRRVLLSVGLAKAREPLGGPTSSSGSSLTGTAPPTSPSTPSVN